MRGQFFEQVFEYIVFIGLLVFGWMAQGVG